MPKDDQTKSNGNKVTNDEKNVFDPGIKKILLAGGAFLMVLLVFTFAQRAGRIPFFTQNFLSLVVLIVIAIQSYIYRGQWRAMQEGLAETRKIVAQNEQSVDAAKKTADLTERSLRIGSRAYLFVFEAMLEAPINTRQYPLPKIVLKNSGNTPAFKHRTRLQHAFLSGDDLEKARKGIMPVLRPMSDRGTGIVGPGSFVSFYPERETWETPEDEERAIKGESVFYVWGLICYRDIFGEEHSSKFSLFAKNARVTRLSFGLFGNELEDEEAKPSEEKEAK